MDSYLPRTQGDKLKANQMHWGLNKDESDDKFLLISLKESEVKSHLFDLDKDDKIILKSVGTDWFIWLGIRDSCGLRKRGNEIKMRTF
jgi:hypothetical protein